jgi:hypothetical protein
MQYNNEPLATVEKAIQQRLIESGPVYVSYEFLPTFGAMMAVCMWPILVSLRTEGTP